MATVFIVGADQGIGYYLAKRLLEQGHQVTVADLHTDRISRLEKDYPESLLCRVADARDQAALDRTVADARERFGDIDAAIHNACLCTFDAEPDTELETYRRVLDVNYLGALRLTKAVLPAMREAHAGRVLFTSSGVGVTGFGNISPYAASKGAIEALAKCLAIENEPYGITFHLLHPPLTKTASAAGLAVPDPFMADPATVGAGLADHLWSKKFVICHSLSQSLQMKLCYRHPLRMGKMMWKMTARAQKPAKNA